MNSFFASTKVDARPVALESTGLSSYVSGNSVLDAEIKWALKCVVSHYSFNSCKGVSSLFQDMFPESNAAKQFTCGATKCAYVVCFGIAPYIKAAMFKCLNEVEEYCLLFDESLNHSTQLKQLDLHVRYWDNNDNSVKTRYYDSLFLGHSTAEDMLSLIRQSTDKLNFSKLLHLSMDGPAVNWKMFSLLQKEIEKECKAKLVNVGSCVLHTVNNCFKNAANDSAWDIDTFLLSLYWLFKDCPARREDFLKLSKTTNMPKHFCRHRWLENGPAAERALKIWEDLKEYVNNVEKGKLKKPKCKSFRDVALACHDTLMPVKLNFFLSVSNILQPFLINYQANSPLLPFLANDIKKICLDLLQTFNVMNREARETLKTPYKLMLFDFADKRCYTDIGSISLGFIGNKELKDIKRKYSVPEKQVMDLKHDCQQFILKLVDGLSSKTPIQYALVRYLSCLDPRKMISDSHGCFTKMRNILSILANAKKIEEADCDKTLLEYQEFLNEAMSNSLQFENFEPYTSRIDIFFNNHLNGKNNFKNIWAVVRKLLVISHGQASVERGFSINKQIEEDNLVEPSFVAKRLIIDEIKLCGGLENYSVTKELQSAVSGARQKYLAHLEEEKKKRAKEMGKRKNHLAELEELKSKRVHLERSVQELQNSADKLSEKAENTGNMQFIVQSNSFRRTSKAKFEEIKEIDLQIKYIVASLKS